MNAEMQNEVFLGENVGSYESYPKPLTTDEYYLEKMYRLLVEYLNTSNPDIPDLSAFVKRDVSDLVNYYTKSETYAQTEVNALVSGFITRMVNDLANYYTKSETYTRSEVNTLVSDFITRMVNDLANYYTKSETYTQSEVNALVSAIPKFKIEVTQTLPTTNISDTTVYLVPDTNSSSTNLYTEYIYVNNDWEMLGTQTVDLSGYVTTTDLNTALTNALATKADLVHTHGNVTNAGAITTAGVALASGDSLVFADASDSNKLKKTSLTVGTGTTTYLRNDGTWAIPSAPDILYAPASPDYSFYYANNGGGNCSTPLSTAVSNYSYIEVVTANFGCFKSPVINGVCDIWVSAALSNNAGGIPTLHVYTEKWHFSGTTWNRTPVNDSTEVPNYDKRNVHYIIKNGSSVSSYKDVVTASAAYYDSAYSDSAIGVYRILGYK